MILASGYVAEESGRHRASIFVSLIFLLSKYGFSQDGITFMAIYNSFCKNTCQCIPAGFLQESSGVS
jgi:hypothetical protein